MWLCYSMEQSCNVRPVVSYSHTKTISSIMTWLAAWQVKMDAVTSTQRAGWETQRGKAGNRQTILRGN
jgi:hypothetical protein